MNQHDHQQTQETNGEPQADVMLTPVTSSNLAAVGYDALSQTLYIEFKTPSLYAFYDVPEYVWSGLMGAGSLGKATERYFHGQIRDNYRYHRLR